MQMNTLQITRKHTYSIRITPSAMRIGWVPMWASRIRVVDATVPFEKGVEEGMLPNKSA